MNFFVLPSTKEDILKKICNQAVLGHHTLPIVEKKIIWKSMVPQNSVFRILQNIFLCVQQNKDTLTGLEQLEGE